MKEWTIDLHIHSLLSPCAQEEMLPEAVIDKALQRGLDVIAITDHNSCGNVAAFVEKGKEKGIIVVPGMELQTQEDIHLICLFDETQQALDFEKAIKPYFMDAEALAHLKFRGNQWLVDKEGNHLRQEPDLLLSSLQISVNVAVDLVHSFGGICIAAHIDRPAFSVYAVFGMLPEDIPFDGIELTCHLPRDPLILQQIKELGYHYLTASDAHCLEHIQELHCAVYLDHWSVNELKLAMQGKDGRQLETLR
jgi:PHP family Zn ribbon phosphoesterase